MTQEVLDAFLSEFSEDTRPKTAEELARELVKQEKLTAFQAKSIYKGRGKSLVLGNYAVLDKLGQGGMGMVLKAEHRRMERLVALKVLSPKLTKTDDMLNRFHREVKAAAKLEHPNIVAAYDADEANGTHFFVMQYVEGRDLSSLLKKKGPLPIGQALDCVIQSAKGLQYAHEQGVIHRDIKPANLLLDTTGTVKILDMGLARIESIAGDPNEADLTGSGTIMGTVDYMSPEQAISTKSADARSDIYSLGITLWYLLVGRAAYEGDSLMARMMAHQQAPIPSLSEQRADVPAAVEAVFQKMVSKKPEERYQTMTEVIADLEQCQAGNIDAAGLSVSVQKDNNLSDFLQGLDSGQSGSLAAMQTEPAKTRAADPKSSPTVVSADASEITDPKSQMSLPPRRQKGKRKPATAASAPPLWKNPKIQIGAGAGIVVLVLLVMLIPGGSKEPDMPEQASVVPTEETGKVEGRKPGATGSTNAPPPAIAPFDEAQAKKHQQAWADHLGVPVEYENSIGMKFRLIPPGEFMMGSTPEEIEAALEVAGEDEAWRERVNSEGPQHKVVLTQPIYVGVTEVNSRSMSR